MNIKHKRRYECILHDVQEIKIFYHKILITSKYFWSILLMFILFNENTLKTLNCMQCNVQEIKVFYYKITSKYFCILLIFILFNEKTLKTFNCTQCNVQEIKIFSYEIYINRQIFLKYSFNIYSFLRKHT